MSDGDGLGPTLRSGAGVSAPGPAAPHADEVATPTIRVEELSKDYRLGANVVPALRGISLTIRPGEMVAVMGPSGSGKSTFMSLIGCLDRPTGGRYWLEGRLVSGLSPAELARIRNRKIGFVFQMFNLLPRASALANVLLPLVYAGVTGQKGRERALAALAAVGLADRAGHKPGQLSGGEQQRVAIARSLVTAPEIILADEPTGNLDTRASVEVMAILQTLNDLGITVVVVTHEAGIASYCPRVVTFQDGKIVADIVTAQRQRASGIMSALPDESSGGGAS